MSKFEPREFVLKNGRKGIIHSAKKSDAKSLLKIFDAIVGHDKYNITTLADVEKLNMTVEKEEKYIEEHNKDGNLVILAEVDKKVAGMLNIENGDRQRIAHVGTLHISVVKKYRRNGVGKALMETVIEWASDHLVIEKIGLGVFSNNVGAINLYKKLGFAEEGRKVKEIKIGPNNYVDIILMYKFVK